MGHLKRGEELTIYQNAACGAFGGKLIQSHCHGKLGVGVLRRDKAIKTLSYSSLTPGTELLAV